MGYLRFWDKLSLSFRGRRFNGIIGRLDNASKEFYLLILLSSLFFLTNQTIQPILPLYIVERGASTFELGLIMSILSFTAIVAKLPMGMIAERIGKWSVIPVALLAQSIILLLYSLVSTPSQFYPVRVLHALIAAAFSPTALAIASDLAPPGKRGDRIGRFLTSFGLASMFGPFLCSFLLNYLNFVELFQFSSIIPLLGLILFLKTRRSSYTLPSKTEEQRGEVRFSLTASLRNIITSRNVLILSFLRLIFSLTNSFFITLFAVYASENLLLTSSLIATLFGVKGVTNTIFRFPSGRLSDRIGHKIPLVASYTALTIVYLLIAESKDFYLLIFVMILYGLAHATRAVTEWSLLGYTTSQQISGVATAYLSTMFNVGEALGAVTSGILTLTLSTESIFKLASIITIPGIFIPLLIRSEIKRRTVTLSS